VALERLLDVASRYLIITAPVITDAGLPDRYQSS
jgi:hypothetical protein